MGQLLGRAACVAFIIAAAPFPGGCALAMLNGAAGAGGSTQGGSTQGGSTQGGSTQGGSTDQPDQRAASQRAADDAISTAVRSRLAANPAVRPFNLGVDTHDGVVTLRGQVAKVAQRNAAQLDARAVHGVKSVQNLITVR
jgi:BON domain